MNEQEMFWGGSFGDDYLKRNRVQWTDRIPFWCDVMNTTQARSIYEVGANAAWNLSAIRRGYPHVGLHGCEINAKAAMQAIKCGFPVANAPALEELACYDGAFDLVVTSGVLIHVGPEDIDATMRAIVRASNRYVLAVEYADEQEVEVEYRGNAGKLWRRPFGRMYQDMGLRLVREWPRAQGFDNCHAWLLERQA